MAWMRLNGKHRRALIWIILFLYISYLEYFTYVFHSKSWHKLSCPPNSHCTSLLLVADPQILGEHDEPNKITIWDSDRYLRRTFASALLHTKPDGVIFLGDLMDEGNRADDFQFQRYVDRFFTIFPQDSLPKTIFLPGDNDIGGENGDPILPSIVERFQYSFHKKSELRVGSCKILKVNAVLEPTPRVSKNEAFSDADIRIAVSHFPLLGMSTPFTHRMLKDYKPEVIFSAHSHLSRLKGASMSTPSTFFDVLGPMPLNARNRSRGADYDDGWPHPSMVYEIEVPTCSYRMGVDNMGYGYALIDETRRELQYGVLWLPHRIFHLKLYFVPIVIFFILLVRWCLCTPCRSHQKYNLLNNEV